VRCLVPKLKGLTLAKATSALRAANCTLGKVTKKKVRKGKKGVVVSHSPAAGQSLPAGSPVKVTVSAKKR
jgi:beta-lactam-binding protein with PASTA domain